MKRLTCEMCGSTDLIKQDGVFVCQSCGCKYSVEEARKMMIEGTVEVTGTVQVDNSHLIQNFLDMAKNALDAGNNAEAELYCNKIIEIKPASYEAWFIKGKAVGWQSTLANQRISETVNAFSKALEYCPEEEKSELADKCKTEIEDLHKALLTARMKLFVDHPADSDVQGLSNDVENIMTNTIQFLVKAGVSIETFGLSLAKIIFDSLTKNWERIANTYLSSNGGYPDDYDFKTYLAAIDYYIEAVKLGMVLLGEGESTDLSLYDTRASAYDYLVALNNGACSACSYRYNTGFYGPRYVKGLTLTNEAIAARNAQNNKWQAEARKWRSKKAIQVEKNKEAEKERRKTRRCEHFRTDRGICGLLKTDYYYGPCRKDGCPYYEEAL